VSKQPITSVLFDLDGTLLDTVEDFLSIILRMAAERGLPPVPADVVRAQVSNGSVGMLCAAFDISADDPLMAALRDDFLQRYERDLAVHTRPFDGIEPLLDWLDERGLPWGVVTNKLSRFSIPLMDAMGYGQRCQSLICPDQVSFSKPHPEPLLKACAAMGVKPQSSVFIGDHLRDIQAGIAAGMPTIAALYGYIPTSENPASWHASHLVNHATELRPWLQQGLDQESLDV